MLCVHARSCLSQVSIFQADAEEVRHQDARCSAGMVLRARGLLGHCSLLQSSEKPAVAKPCSSITREDTIQGVAIHPGSFEVCPEADEGQSLPMTQPQLPLHHPHQAVCRDQQHAGQRVQPVQPCLRHRACATRQDSWYYRGRVSCGLSRPAVRLEGQHLSSGQEHSPPHGVSLHMPAYCRNCNAACAAPR